MRKEKFEIDFAFFTHLWDFYFMNKSKIRSKYKMLSKKMLDFNDYQNPNSYLRQPQYEALEMYIFLKEYQDNKKIHDIFNEWYERKNSFENRKDLGLNKDEQISWLAMEIEEYKSVFNRMKKYELDYPNYIFALTMGTGKTILMATCIFYEFLLANKFPKDDRFCHNAIVFAPDKTVLESLKEIQTFDKSKVIPSEYLSWLDSNLKIHFMENSGTTLNTIDQSKYNLIISNTQKIILKRKRKDKSKVDNLFDYASLSGSVYNQIEDLYDYDQPTEEEDLIDNQRFSKLVRLENLGIYIDEAHHVFGATLAKDLGLKKSTTSLRLTINELAKALRKSGTNVVGCYNYTGTPYADTEIFPEVVYSYGLKDAISKGYLKKVNVQAYTNPKTIEFLRISVKDFWEKYNTDRYEGMLPKLAIFSTTIEELQNVLKPALEEILYELGIPLDKILVNVGDSKLTSNDDIREFNRLDTPESTKQFILLVNKGREGWNCRSLFGVALYRKPKSKIFVLQATMRCLRAIGPVQETGSVYLSEENLEILDDELNKNFRLSISDLESVNVEKENYKIKVNYPRAVFDLKRSRNQHVLKEKKLKEPINFHFESIDYEKFKLRKIEQTGLNGIRKIGEDLIEMRERRLFSDYMLIAEISKYLNISCLKIEKILSESVEGIDEVRTKVNKYNDILYEVVIPKLFNSLFEHESYKKLESYNVQLVKEPKEGFYQLSAKPELVVKENDVQFTGFKQKSFHLDTYCFDSRPEKKFFEDIIGEEEVEEIYFTGMLTHGQTDFFIQYIDPSSNTVRNYYPDFLIKKKNSKYLIVEVKGDNKIHDPVVLAKGHAAREMGDLNGMEYKIIAGSLVMKGESKHILK